MHVRHRAAGLVLSSLLVGVACSDDNSGAAATPSPDTTTTAAVVPQAVETTTSSVDTQHPVERLCREGSGLRHCVV